MKATIAAVYLGFLLWLGWQTSWNPFATPAAGASVQVDAAYAQAGDTLPRLLRRLEELRQRDGAYPATGGDWVVLSRSLGPEALAGFDALDRAERIDARWQAPPLAYLYRSDGADYKLIAHSPDLGLCLKAHDKDPAAVDPVRTYYAFGFTPGPHWSLGDPAQRQAAVTIIQARRNQRMRDDPALIPHIHATCGAFGHWTAGALFW